MISACDRVQVKSRDPRKSRHLCLAIACAVLLLAASDRSKAAATQADRPSVVGRVVDDQGRPLPFVTVGICRENTFLLPPFWPSLTKWTRTDAAGRFTMPGVKPGEYDVVPISGIEITGGTTPPDQIPADLRNYADKPGTHRLSRALPAAFVTTKVTVKAEGKPAEIEIKALKTHRLTVRFIDSAGNPAEAKPDAYPIYGKIEAKRWTGGFDRVPGTTDTMTALVPASLKDLSIQTRSDNVWWTWAPETPRVSHAGIRLKRLDGDRLEIVAQRFRSNSLEIRIKPTAGKLPNDADVSVSYPTQFRGEGGSIPQRVGDGIYRLDEMLLPGRDCQVMVAADGFKDTMTRTFRFLDEGQLGVVEFSIKPGVRANQWKFADALPIELKTPEGQLIPQLGEPRGPERAITCRAVDKITGKPVADAVVEVEIERRVKENKDDLHDVHDASETSETRTDADGRFTVAIAEKVINNRSPLEKTEATIRIKHPNYVTYWNSLRVSELAKKPITDHFPEFRAVTLIPARRISGRVVDAEGKPVKEAQIYQATPRQIFIPPRPEDKEVVFLADLPETDDDGRFAFNAPIGAALKLEFRAIGAAENYVDVPADKTDLGEIRISPGVRIFGQVLDPKGAPVNLINVTTPPWPNPESQPISSLTTDKDGRFQTGELAPGTYRAVVGDFFHDEQGKPTGYNCRLAPGLYVPFPFEIRDGQRTPELTIRPVPHVTFIAKLVTTRPDPKPAAGEGKEVGMAEALLELGQRVASLSVTGTYQGIEWASGSSYLNLSDEMTTCTVRVPKGLVDAKLEFGPAVQRFKLGPDAPELFGPVYRVGKAEADLTTITFRRYRDTTLKLTLITPDGKPLTDPKLEVHYVREPTMKAAGVIFDPTPYQAKFEGNTTKLSVLPDEEFELKVPGADPVRVKLTEGETRALTLTAPAAIR